MLGIAVAMLGIFGLYEVIEAPQSAAFAPVITRVAPGTIALTYDDGPNPSVTPQLVALLAREHVAATFFIVGRAAEHHPQLVAQLLRAGNELENHTETHAHLNVISSVQIEREVDGADAALQSAGAPPPIFMRPPFGARNALVLATAHQLGKRVVLWTDAALPAGSLTPAVMAHYLDALGSGPIVLLHDGDRGRDGNGGRTAEALRYTDAIITAARARGYRFVTLREALVARS